MKFWHQIHSACIRLRISESITVGPIPDVIEASPTVLVPLWCRCDIGKEFQLQTIAFVAERLLTVAVGFNPRKGIRRGPLSRSDN
jgi:hypothetical protein